MRHPERETCRKFNRRRRRDPALVSAGYWEGQRLWPCRVGQRPICGDSHRPREGLRRGHGREQRTRQWPRVQPEKSSKPDWEASRASMPSGEVRVAPYRRGIADEYAGVYENEIMRTVDRQHRQRSHRRVRHQAADPSERHNGASCPTCRPPLSPSPSRRSRSLHGRWGGLKGQRGYFARNPAGRVVTVDMAGRGSFLENDPNSVLCWETLGRVMQERSSGRDTNSYRVMSSPTVRVTWRTKLTPTGISLVG